MKLSLENIFSCHRENSQNGPKFNMTAKNHVTPQNSHLETQNLNLGSKKSKWPPNSTWLPKIM